MYWFSKDDEFARTCLDLISPDADNATNLKQIRDALTIDVEDDTEIDFDNLSSIPDIWATHRIFDMMLYLPPNVRKEDPVLEQYRAAVVRQWKAILTVMLIGESEFPLKILASDFSAKIIAQHAAGGTPADRFMGAVVSARPASFIWGDESAIPFNHDKIQVYFIEANGERLPIAVSSPTTYYVPAPDAWKNLYGRVPWIKKTTDMWGRARYRVEDDFLEKLSYAQAVALQNALQNGLRKPAAAPIDKNQNRAGMYSELVSGFIKDPNLTASLDSFREEALFVPEFSYFSGMVSSLTPDDSDPILGAVDSSCYHIESTPYNDIEGSNYYYVQYFMPITELCKRMLANDELDYSIEVKSGIGRILEATVTLTRKRDGARLRRSYGEAHPIYRIERMSDVSSVTLWPRRRIDGWKAYFAFRYDEVFEISQITRRANPRYTVRPDDPSSGSLPIPTKRPGEKYLYYCMDKFPEYWVVEKTEGEQTRAIGYIKTRADNDIPAPNANNTYFAAIDFGTTSTMLYGAVNSGRPGPISASALYAGAVCNPARDKGQEQNTACFVPAKTDAWEIALLHSVLALAPEIPGVVTGALYGNWAFFRAAATEKRARLRMEQSDVHSNLKWNVLNPYDTDHYITEMLYFLALEARMHACKTLHIYASYPGAMYDSRRKTYLKLITKNLTSIAKKTGVDTAPVSPITESFAAATEAAKGGLATDFCVIDIGGGTSDIFLYYKPDLQRPWQGMGSSLRIGARGIFHSEFWQNPALLGSILEQGKGNDSIEKFTDQFLTRNPIDGREQQLAEIKPDALTEEQMHSITEELLEFRIRLNGRFYPVADMLQSLVVESKDPQILNFRLRIAYYLGAVCYYAGMMTRERRGTASLDISKLTIRFAGNGSKIIDWISGSDKSIADYVKEMFRAGAKQTETPETVEFSSNPKHEVARGALLSRENGLDVKEQNLILAGEHYQLDGEAHSEFSNAGSIIYSESFEPEQDELKAFLAAFRDAVGGVVPYRPECRRYEFPIDRTFGLKNKIKQEVQSMQNKSEGLKPIFLVGVEVLDSLSH